MQDILAFIYKYSKDISGMLLRVFSETSVSSPTFQRNLLSYGPDNGGSMYLRNTYQHLPDCGTQHYLHMSPKGPEI